MQSRLWKDILLPGENDDHVWDLFHENSKIGRHVKSLSDEEVLARMHEFHESLPFDGYPRIDLPVSSSHLKLSLEQALMKRVSARSMKPSSLSLQDLATLLRLSYGITRDNKETGFPRPFRVVPSAGAVYPLEIFVHSAHVTDLFPGLYHYNPAENCLRQIRAEDETNRISEALIQPEIAFGASLIIFLTAVFERAVFKYEDRGYRFVMLEAGHVAQNLNLISNGLGLGSLNIGGYFDRDIDDFLQLDGLTQSTVYLIAIGKSPENNQSSVNCEVKR